MYAQIWMKLDPISFTYNYLWYPAKNIDLPAEDKGNLSSRQVALDTGSKYKLFTGFNVLRKK